MEERWRYGREEKKGRERVVIGRGKESKRSIRMEGMGRKGGGING